MKEIPKNAKLAFKGVLFETWQWEQPMFDGSVEIFECQRRPNTASVVAVIDDKILIQNQRQPDRQEPFVSLPGGRCDKEDWSEDPLAAAKRELLEETGYASDDWLLWYQYQQSYKTISTVYTYIAKNCEYRRAPRLDAGEKIENRLIGFEEFLLLSESPDFWDRELKLALFRARLDESFRQELRKLFFN